MLDGWHSLWKSALFDIKKEILASGAIGTVDIGFTDILNKGFLVPFMFTIHTMRIAGQFEKIPAGARFTRFIIAFDARNRRMGRLVEVFGADATGRVHFL